LTGTFDKWSRSVRLNKGPSGFTATVKLPWERTRVAYKYIIDGRWSHRYDQPTEYDYAGNLNNVYTLPPRPDPPPPADPPAAPKASSEPPKVEEVEAETSVQEEDTPASADHQEASSEVEKEVVAPAHASEVEAASVPSEPAPTPEETLSADHQEASNEVEKEVAAPAHASEVEAASVPAEPAPSPEETLSADHLEVSSEVEEEVVEEEAAVPAEPTPSAPTPEETPSADHQEPLREAEKDTQEAAVEETPSHASEDVPARASADEALSLPAEPTPEASAPAPKDDFPEFVTNMAENIFTRDGAPMTLSYAAPGLGAAIHSVNVEKISTEKETAAPTLPAETASELTSEPGSLLDESAHELFTQPAPKPEAAASVPVPLLSLNVPHTPPPQEPARADSVEVSTHIPLGGADAAPANVDAKDEAKAPAAEPESDGDTLTPEADDAKSAASPSSDDAASTGATTTPPKSSAPAPPVLLATPSTPSTPSKGAQTFPASTDSPGRRSASSSTSPGIDTTVSRKKRHSLFGKLKEIFHVDKEEKKEKKEKKKRLSMSA
jgi:hypothetical protein